VGNADLYQLYAYHERYGCGQSLLLYPRVQGNEERDFHVLDQHGQMSSRKVGIWLVLMNRNLNALQERENLATELERLVRSRFESGSVDKEAT
jgi:5-methylcytosine-specific restriction endonuclease McrBC regulatory subunit McrC